MVIILQATATAFGRFCTRPVLPLTKLNLLMMQLSWVLAMALLLLWHGQQYVPMNFQKDEFANSIEVFKNKMGHYQPKYIAFLGKPAYLAFSGKKQITWGHQPDDFCGAKVWVLPNPSGLNRGFTLNDLVASYSELYTVIKHL
jgi:hypothetical protein